MNTCVFDTHPLPPATFPWTMTSRRAEGPRQGLGPHTVCQALPSFPILTCISLTLSKLLTACGPRR